MISRFGSKLGFKHLKFRICLAITIFFIGCILFNTPKIIDPVLYVIGPDSPMSTIGWSLMIIGCFSACSYFTMAVCDILKGYTRVCEPSSRLKIEQGTERVSSWVYRVWAPVIPCLLTLIVASVVPEYAMQMHALHLSLIGFLFLLYAYLVVFTVGLFITEINKHIDSHPEVPDDLKRVSCNLTRIKLLLGSTMAFTFPVLLLCGALEFLRRNVMYLMLFLALPFYAVFMAMSYQLVGKKNAVHVIQSRRRGSTLTTGGNQRTSFGPIQ